MRGKSIYKNTSDKGLIFNIYKEFNNNGVSIIQ